MSYGCNHNLLPKTWALCINRFVSQEGYVFCTGCIYRMKNSSDPKKCTWKHNFNQGRKRTKLWPKILVMSYETIGLEEFTQHFRPIESFVDLTREQKLTALDQFLAPALNRWWAMFSWAYSKAYCFELLELSSNLMQGFQCRKNPQGSMSHGESLLAGWLQ